MVERTQERRELVVEQARQQVDGDVLAGGVAPFEVGQGAAQEQDADGDLRGCPVVVTLHALVERGDWDHQEMVQIPLGPLADARLAVEALGDALIEMTGKLPRLADAMKAGFHGSPTSEPTTHGVSPAPIDRGAIAVTQSLRTEHTTSNTPFPLRVAGEVEGT